MRAPYKAFAGKFLFLFFLPNTSRGSNARMVGDKERTIHFPADSGFATVCVFILGIEMPPGNSLSNLVSSIFPMKDETRINYKCLPWQEKVRQILYIYILFNSC